MFISMGIVKIFIVSCNVSTK